ncbi:MAG: hypothetical protein WAM14_05150 [Candidatus Nitrosopolaris sp.]
MCQTRDIATDVFLFITPACVWQISKLEEYEPFVRMGQPTNGGVPLTNIDPTFLAGGMGFLIMHSKKC